VAKDYSVVATLIGAQKDAKAAAVMAANDRAEAAKAHEVATQALEEAHKEASRAKQASVEAQQELLRASVVARVKATKELGAHLSGEESAAFAFEAVVQARLARCPVCSAGCCAPQCSVVEDVACRGISQQALALAFSWHFGGAKAGSGLASLVKERGLGKAAAAAWLVCLGKTAASAEEVAIAAAGGVEAVLAAMRAHAADAMVQQIGCGALVSLAVNDENKVAIAAAGGVEAVLAAMSAHNSLDVQRMCQRAFDNLP
jgi:hypothetical protein